MSDDVVLLYDFTGAPVATTSAPVTSRPGQKLASPQGGIMSLGSDYAASPSGQTPKVDSAGNQYAVPMMGSVPVPVGVNTVQASPSSLYGSIGLAWSPTNSAFVPFQVDATGAGVVRAALATTIGFASAAAVSTTAAAGKSMLSFYNAGSMYHRLLGLYAMCPPQANTTGGLLGLGSGTSYVVIPMGIYRFTTAHTGGTAVAGSVFDTRDIYDPTLTCRTGATIAGQASAPMEVFDAAANSPQGYAVREDVGAKVMTIGPGEGINIVNLNALGGSGANFFMRAVLAQNTA